MIKHGKEYLIQVVVNQKNIVTKWDMIRTPKNQSKAPLHYITYIISLPKDEDKEHEQHAEGGHVVHGLH